MDQRSVANGTHARIGRILAALALLATALVGVVALPAGPAQAGGDSIVICEFVEINGHLLPVNCVRIPLPTLAAWPPLCRRRKHVILSRVDAGCLPVSLCHVFTDHSATNLYAIRHSAPPSSRPSPVDRAPLCCGHAGPQRR